MGRRMYPNSLALIDDDHDYADFLGEHLRGLGMDVQVFNDSNDLLADVAAFERDFYVVDLTLPGVDGLDLIKILRRRTSAGVLVVSGRLGPEVFKNVLGAGADMYLAKPIQFEQVALAIAAVQRRIGGGLAGGTAQAWKLDLRASELVAPDGARVSLSEIDRTVLQCLLQAQGQPVTRQALLERLGREPAQEGDDGLNATIYRLRQRIKRATPALVPLQAKSRVGYVFQAPLTAL
jgi:two-component system, OmpR family, response regulator